jgi:hypothetical protein
MKTTVCQPHVRMAVLVTITMEIFPVLVHPILLAKHAQKVGANNTTHHFKM